MSGEMTLFGQDVTALIELVSIALILLVFRATGKSGSAAIDAAVEAYRANQTSNATREEVRNGVTDRLDEIDNNLTEVSSRVGELEKAEQRRRGR